MQSDPPLTTQSYCLQQEPRASSLIAYVTGFSQSFTCSCGLTGKAVDIADTASADQQSVCLDEGDYRVGILRHSVRMSALIRQMFLVRRNSNSAPPSWVVTTRPAFHHKEHQSRHHRFSPEPPLQYCDDINSQAVNIQYLGANQNSYASTCYAQAPSFSASRVNCNLADGVVFYYASSATTTTTSPAPTTTTPTGGTTTPGGLLTTTTPGGTTTTVTGGGGAPAQQSRRSRKARGEIQAPVGLCPVGLTPCVVQGYEAFEVSPLLHPTPAWRERGRGLGRG